MIAVDDSGGLSAISETLGGSLRSAGEGEWVQLATSLGGVNGGLKVFVAGFIAISGLGEVEFKGGQLLLN